MAACSWLNGRAERHKRKLFHVLNNKSFSHDDVATSDFTHRQHMLCLCEYKMSNRCHLSHDVYRDVGDHCFLLSSEKAIQDGKG